MMDDMVVSNNAVGRPLKFRSVEELQTAIAKYFQECKENDEPYTITGLCLALDTTRDLLIDYQNKDAFSDTIKKAKLMCENYAERQLFKARNVIGVIFNLKNNYGWKDQQSIDLQASAKQQDLSNMTDDELDEALIMEVIQKRPEIVARLAEKNK